MGALLTNATRRAIKGWMNESECCGQPMRTYFDIFTHSCTDHDAEMLECYYRSCDTCGNDESRTYAEIRDEARRELAAW